MYTYPFGAPQFPPGHFPGIFPPPILDAADISPMFTIAEWYAAKMLSIGLSIYFDTSFNF